MFRSIFNVFVLLATLVSLLGMPVAPAYAAAGAWENVGSAGFSAGSVDWNSLALDSNGTPYVAYRDAGNGFKATVMKYDALSGSWVTVGSAGFSAWIADYISLAIDSSDTPYVAYRDGGNSNYATVMKYDALAGSWATVGSAGFSAGAASFTSLALDSSGTPYVTYRDGGNANKTTVMKYDTLAGSWATVGSAGFSALDVSYTTIAFDSSDTPYVAYQDYGYGLAAVVMKFDALSGNWVAVGTPGFSAGYAYYISLALDSNDAPYVAYQYNPYAAVMKYDALTGNWVTVGTAGFSAGIASYTSIALDSSDTPYVAYRDSGNGNRATVMKYNALSGSWENVGSAGFSAGQAVYTSLAIDSSDTPYVAYRDGGSSSKTTVMKFAAPNSAPTDISLDNNDVDENQPSGTLVGTLSTTDPDSGDTFTYSFCGGTDDASFQINADQLQTNAIFDYETKSSYSVCIRTSDSGSLTYDETFTITVNNLNESGAPTDLALDNNDVDENQPSGTLVGTLSTTDPDSGDTFTYSFCGGTDDVSFQINADQLQTNASFDYETKSSYSICVRTTDSGALTFDETFTITVNDLSNAVEVSIGNATVGSYVLAAQESQQQSYIGANGGPVKITHTDNVPIVAAERVIYEVSGVDTSFTEMIGLPDNQLDTTYWLPWYNNTMSLLPWYESVILDTQLRFANVSASTATVHVYIGGAEMTGSPFTLAAGESTRKSFPGVNAGPVQIVSDQDIVAAERVIYKVNGVNTSFSEMMALPASQLDTTYWLPWYNNVDLHTQLRFANVSASTATVHVYIGGAEMTGSPFTLAAGESTRKSFPNINAGPVQIVSDQDIVAAERVIYNVNDVDTSFSEMMALPDNQLDTTYWLPWYNSVELDTQLRFANTTNTTATVHVYIGGVEMTGSPFALLPGESTRKSFPTINNGLVQIVSDQNIVAAERVIYKVNGVATSFTEMMALPNTLLDTTYWFPWYNNIDLDTQLRFGVP